MLVLSLVIRARNRHGQNRTRLPRSVWSSTYPHRFFLDVNSRFGYKTTCRISMVLNMWLHRERAASSSHLLPETEGYISPRREIQSQCYREVIFLGLLQDSTYEFLNSFQRPGFDAESSLHPFSPSWDWTCLRESHCSISDGLIVQLWSLQWLSVFLSLFV